MDQEPAQLFLKDFSIGQRFAGAPRTVAQADVLSFSALTGDKHPLHYDAEYAKTTRFGRPIVHGLHLLSLTALGAMPLSEQLRQSMVAFLNQEARFLKPVFVDDTLRAEFEIAQVERRPGKEWGTLGMSVRLINQRNETVLEGRHDYRLRCRADATARKES
jgi:3-hydroxybutyryl-CoA dehydratase